VLIRLLARLFVLTALSVFGMNATYVCVDADDAVIDVTANMKIAAEDDIDDRTCYPTEAGCVGNNPVPDLEPNPGVHSSLSWLLVFG
jgi:hypothetical protein